MQGRKKLNLLPTNAKNNYWNRNLKCIVGIVGLTLICSLVFLKGFAGLVSLTNNRLQRDNEKYNAEKIKMANLQTSIAEHKFFIESFAGANFPFARFMQDMELRRPFGVSIISVDSVDRLAEVTEQPENEEAEQPKIEYSRDLNGERFVIRGYSSSQEAISKFIYDISNLSYIRGMSVTAIEEHSMDEQQVNIFELVVTGGVDI